MLTAGDVGDVSNFVSCAGGSGPVGLSEAQPLYFSGEPGADSIQSSPAASSSSSSTSSTSSPFAESILGVCYMSGIKNIKKKYFFEASSEFVFTNIKATAIRIRSSLGSSARRACVPSSAVTMPLIRLTSCKRSVLCCVRSFT